MTGTQLLMVCGGILTALVITLLVVRARVQRMRQEARRKAILKNMLALAQEQNEIFDVKILHPASTHKALSCTLLAFNETSLQLEVLTYISQEMAGMDVEVYFRATLPEGPSFYKFQSTVQSVAPGRDKSNISLAMPAELDAGQKRHFIRIKPPKEKVRVIGIWELDKSKPFPRNTGEIPSPLIHYKCGMDNEPVQVENISATGMALRFPMSSLETKPVDLDKGSQLLCLIIYNTGKDDRVVTFWCICHVLHVRVHESAEPALVLGTEFTNWAVLEQGKSDIHWFHSASSRGVSPITQWVMYMDMERKTVL